LIESSRAFLACCCLAGALASIQAACGGGSTPASPSPAPQPQPAPTPAPPATPAERWTVAGRVVAMADGRPLGGAHVTSEVGPSMDTDAGGAFRIGSNTNPPFTPHAFDVTAAGFLDRRAYVRRRVCARTSRST
jgi:hypothetical protein